MLYLKSERGSSSASMLDRSLECSLLPQLTEVESCQLISALPSSSGGRPFSYPQLWRTLTTKPSHRGSETLAKEDAPTATRASRARPSTRKTEPLRLLT